MFGGLLCLGDGCLTYGVWCGCQGSVTRLVYCSVWVNGS